MIKIDEMVNYLEESILYETYSDIWLLPRPEFSKYVTRYGKSPELILTALKREQKSVSNKVKRFLDNKIQIVRKFLCKK